MNTVLRRRAGAAISALGLVVVMSGLGFVSAAPAQAVEQTSPVCNNIHDGQDPSTCHSGGPYGDVDWDVAGGNLVLHVTGVSGIGWADVRVCAPYGPPEDGADCGPNDAGRLPTSAYTVAMTSPTGATAASSDGKSVQFDPCGSEFVVTVPTSAFVGGADWWWAIHLAPGGGQGCGGTGTHEAFGHFVAAAATTTTTTTMAPTTTTTLAPTTTTTTPGEETTTTTAAPTTTTTAAPTTTTTASVVGTNGSNVLVEVSGNQAEVLAETTERTVLPVAEAQAPAGGTLPVTGSSTSSLLVLAGVALLIGGAAVGLGEPDEQH